MSPPDLHDTDPPCPRPRWLRIGLHSLALALANLAGLAVGFAAYHLLNPNNQLAVQVPIAAGISLVGFSIWIAVTHRTSREPGDCSRLALERRRDGIWIYLSAVLWSALLFLPAHWITTGYVSAVSNIGMLALFQLAVNLFVVPASLEIVR